MKTKAIILALIVILGLTNPLLVNKANAQSAGCTNNFPSDWQSQINRMATAVNVTLPASRKIVLYCQRYDYPWDQSYNARLAIVPSTTNVSFVNNRLIIPNAYLFLMPTIEQYPYWSTGNGYVGINNIDTGVYQSDPQAYLQSINGFSNNLSSIMVSSSQVFVGQTFVLGDNSFSPAPTTNILGAGASGYISGFVDAVSGSLIYVLGVLAFVLGALFIFRMMHKTTKKVWGTSTTDDRYQYKNRGKYISPDETADYWRD